MTRRLATILLATMILVGISPPAVRAQGDEVSNATLKGLSVVALFVDTLPGAAKTLGLSESTIQTDVELKLRLAGMRVVTQEEELKLPGAPYLYVGLNMTNDAKAACIAVKLDQNVRLLRNGQLATSVVTWDTGAVIANPTVQGIRDAIKDGVDEFLNAWLSVNPRK